ncbi:MAG: arsenate reductase ArsC [Phototrophicaceae bacterium]|jgi:arsenate reductase
MIHVLVLCTHNSSRSQMAEGLIRALGQGQITVESAGSAPSRVNPFAIEAMQLRGIDISGHTSKSLTQFLSQPFDYVITVCDDAAETCPLFPGKATRIHWSFPDPSAVQGSDADKLAAFVRVRDGLEEKIQGWLNETLTISQ